MQSTSSTCEDLPGVPSFSIKKGGQLICITFIVRPWHVTKSVRPHTFVYFPIFVYRTFLCSSSSTSLASGASKLRMVRWMSYAEKRHDLIFTVSTQLPFIHEYHVLSKSSTLRFVLATGGGDQCLVCPSWGAGTGNHSRELTIIFLSISLRDNDQILTL